MRLLANSDDINDAFSRILAFYEPESTIVLTGDEDKILTRWLHCDSLIRSRKYKTPDIIRDMMDKFSISKFTAEKDIAQTYALFGQVRVMSKQYVITHAIEDINIKIQKFESDKSLVHLVPKLYQELARMTAMLPDEIAKKQLPVPNIFIGSLTINNGAGEGNKTVMSIDEAREKWKQHKAKKANDDYIDHEDLK